MPVIVGPKNRNVKNLDKILEHERSLEILPVLARAFANFQRYKKPSMKLTKGTKNSKRLRKNTLDLIHVDT